MAKKLDKSRDYAMIVGDDQGRMFEQDGVEFASDGSEWGSFNPAEVMAARRAAPNKRAASEPADDQLSQQLAGA